MTGRERMPDEVLTARTVVRRARATDLAAIAAWPDYPWPLAGLSMGSARPAGGLRWWEKIDEADRCHYSVVSSRTGEIVGVHAFVGIDWAAGTVANMGVRIRPDLCGQGYGTETLKPLLAAVLDGGMASVRLDVAAANGRAVRCYQECGMRIVGEFWREHTAGEIDSSDPKWAFALPHLRRDGNGWQTRFYWLQITRDDRG